MPAPDLTSPVAARLQSIDALRGLVILFMLLDHVRETFLLHMQVPDPMDVAVTEPALFFSRTLAHLCAPVFIFLTGLSAFLYGEKHQGRHAVSSFLLKRGLFLVALEFTLVNFAWTFQFPPQVIYLQVIWAIGLSMLALSALLWLPRPWLVLLGLLIIGGHNLLDPLHFPVGSPMHLPWAILHDRGWLEVSDSLRLRTSYPLLPWIGVIALGYAAGPWFGRNADAERRQQGVELPQAVLGQRRVEPELLAVELAAVVDGEDPGDLVIAAAALAGLGFDELQTVVVFGQQLARLNAFEVNGNRRLLGGGFFRGSTGHDQFSPEITS